MCLLNWWTLAVDSYTADSINTVPTNANSRSSKSDLNTKSKFSSPPCHTAHSLSPTITPIHISHHKHDPVINDACLKSVFLLSCGPQCTSLSQYENEPFSPSQMIPLVSTAACWGRDGPRGLDASSCLSEPRTAPGNLRNVLRVRPPDPPVREGLEDYWVLGLVKCPLWLREKGQTITREYPLLLPASVLPLQLHQLRPFVLAL